MSQGYLQGIGGARIPFIPQTPLGAMQSAMRMAPDFYVQGDQAVDLVSGIALVPVNSPSEDSSTANLGLIEGDPPPPMVTSALDLVGAGQSFDAADNSVNDVGTGSMLAVITFFLRGVPATNVNLFGKRDNGTLVGIELFLDTSEKLNCHVLVSGGALRTVQLPGVFLNNRWHTTVCQIDRSITGGLGGGRLLLGSVDESTSSAANLVQTDIEAGTLANPSVWAVGAQRIGISADMLALHVAVAQGPKTEGRNPKLMARDVSEATWNDQLTGGIIP